MSIGTTDLRLSGSETSLLLAVAGTVGYAAIAPSLSSLTPTPVKYELVSMTLSGCDPSTGDTDTALCAVANSCFGIWA